MKNPLYIGPKINRVSAGVIKNSCPKVMLFALIVNDDIMEA